MNLEEMEDTEWKNGRWFDTFYGMKEYLILVNFQFKQKYI